VNIAYDPRTHLEVIPREECLQLLAHTYLGRLAIVVEGRPLVFPVNYAMDGETIVIRTSEGTKLHGARGHEVAFEIDHADPRYHVGWSVLVVGACEEESDIAALERLAHLPLRPWGEGRKSHVLRIRPRALTGRRIPPHGQPDV
jgi:nitroimidazol reductase NimA-like FMN-containing flavoprotein (pyridoxamine 5'-phosphate oxidase superfamily)